MRIALLGYGRIGRRHADNLRALRPDVDIVVYDPSVHPAKEAGFGEAASVDTALETATAAIIATPADAHLALMERCNDLRLPYLVEKPPVGLGQLEAFEAIVDAAPEGCAVGFQYRFHPVVAHLAAAADRYERVYEFEAREDLVGHYGRTVVETMGSHAIDLGLYLAGEAWRESLTTDGVRLRGAIEHITGARTIIDQRMDCGPRLSRLSDRLLYPDDEMYRAQLRSWLWWLISGERDARLATLQDGLAVVDVMAHIRQGVLA